MKPIEQFKRFATQKELYDNDIKYILFVPEFNADVNLYLDEDGYISGFEPYFLDLIETFKNGVLVKGHYEEDHLNREQREILKAYLNKLELESELKINTKEEAKRIKL